MATPSLSGPDRGPAELHAATPSSSGTVDFAPMTPPPAGLPTISLALPGRIGSDVQSTRDVRDLLRRRLRVACIMGAIAWMLVGLRSLTLSDAVIKLEVVGHLVVGLMLALSVRDVAAALLLTWKPRASLAQLRAVEVFLFSLTSLMFAWLRYVHLRHAFRQEEATGSSLEVQFVIAFSNLPWMSSIILYGIFIPNTWRRTLAGVACLVALVIVTDAAAWLSKESPGYAALPTAVVQTFLMLLLSVGIALFGSFRISTLEQQVRAARQEMRELGQYRLMHRLGEGGMGEVYLAEHRLLKRPCAVKLIRPEYAQNAETIARFEREVQATARLTHPNIVEVYDYGHTEGGTFYYVMEYLEGLSLDELVRRFGRLPPGRALHLLGQVCGALREAHAKGMVHRDIKPSNILVTNRGGVHDVAKVLDFGLVHTALPELAEQKLTQVGHIIGTPDYMPPEQGKSPQHVDARVDVYMLGGVLHFMLTGQPVFLRKSSLETLIAHQRDPVRPLHEHGVEVPAEVEAVMRRCLEKTPADRYADAAALATALDGCGKFQTWTQAEAAAWWGTHDATRA